MVYVFEIKNNKLKHVQNSKVKEWDGLGECSKIFEDLITFTINSQTSEAMKILGKYKYEKIKIITMENNIDDLIHRMHCFTATKKAIPILMKGGGKNLFIEINNYNLRNIHNLKNIIKESQF